MKKLSSLTYEEREQFSVKLQTWLGRYTDTVIQAVAPRFEEIYNDSTAMMLLTELHNRTLREQQDEISTFEMLILSAAEGEGFEDWQVHNHPLTHAGSYRDILYDMYIKDTH